MLNCAHVQICKIPSQETVDHAPAAGCSSQSCGSAPRQRAIGAVRDLIWCQAVPRTFATVLPPLMLPLPIQIPHTKNWRSRGDARITNRWPGGSLRPPDTRRASAFALQDTVRVSVGRPSPPRPPVREPPERCHLYVQFWVGQSPLLFSWLGPKYAPVPSSGTPSWIPEKGQATAVRSEGYPCRRRCIAADHRKNCADEHPTK